MSTLLAQRWLTASLIQHKVTMLRCDVEDAVEADEAAKRHLLGKGTSIFFIFFPLARKATITKL